MSVPYSDNLSWNNYKTNAHWFEQQVPAPILHEDPTKRATDDLIEQVTQQSWKRGIQFVRDLGRLVLKTPIRLVREPFKKEKCIWKQYERAVINAKLTRRTFAQMLAVPVKGVIACAALVTSLFSKQKAEWLEDYSVNLTRNGDGERSKLEALKEEGIVHATTKDEFLQYKAWIEKINPQLCTKVKK